MKGIVLAGGSGTRMFPVSQVVNKQLLPVYDKPMIYYPLSTLMLSGIRDILIISTPKGRADFEDLLGVGSHLGLNLSYATQDNPNGLAEAFIIGKEFIGSDNCALVLGDNLFYGQGLSQKLQTAAKISDGAVVFLHWLADSRPYGVANYSPEGTLLDITEKPDKPKSNWVVTGLYYYDNHIVDVVKDISPSARGELEISDVNNIYLKAGKLETVNLGRGFTWLDMGSHEALIEATQFVRTIELRQGLKISCIEEIALRMNFIDRDQFSALAYQYKESRYGEYLLRVMQGMH